MTVGHVFSSQSGFQWYRNLPSAWYGIKPISFQLQLLWWTLWTFFKQIFKIYLHAFFISNSFISIARLKLAKNQASVKQHPEAELLALENYSHSLFMLSTKNNRTILKNKRKNKCVCTYKIIITKMKMKMKRKRSHRCNINRPRVRHEHKCNKY